MADVTIDGTISTSTARGCRSVVFTTQATGYWFYIDSGGTFVYSKTSDGGATWGAAVTINVTATQIAFDVWYDQWTPGGAGTLIHTWYFDSTNDKVFWRSLDTNGDTLGTERTCFTGASAVAGINAYVSGTKTRSGLLYVCSAIDASNEQYFGRSADSGTTWSAALSATFQEANPDHALLFPATGTGDNDDCWAIYFDSSATALTMKMWDSSAVAQVESNTFQTTIAASTDITLWQHPYSGAIRFSDGALVIAAMDSRDLATTDMNAYVVTAVNAASLTGITTKTAITTNIDDIYHPAVFLNPLNDDIYVAYNGKRDGSEVLGTTTKVYYTKSTDGGTSWSAGDTAYQEGATSVDVQVWAPLTGRRFYVGWRVGTTLIGNKVNSVVPNSMVLAGATLSFAGSIVKRTIKALVGAVSSFVGSLARNTSPAIVLNTTDGSTVSGAPTLEFTGTDPDADDVRYNIKIDDHASFLTIVDSYSETNKNNNVNFLGSGTNTGAAQAFTGDGSKIAAAQFYLSKVASPTGNAFAKLYAITQTFGTNAIPTGAALATSDAFDVSVLTISSVLYTLTFSGANQVRMTNGTHYCIAFEYSGADATNRLFVGDDSSSPTHAGNFSTQTTTGGAYVGGSGTDLVFYVLPVPPLLDKTSGTDLGFANTVTGVDTDPFNSGEKASYTVQAGDTLAAGTYYWTVRSKDPSGTNAYSALATVRSFIVSAATTYPSDLTGALSSSGLIAKRASRTLSGAVAFIGSITKGTARALSSTLSFIGLANKRTSRSLTAALSFIGAISKLAGKTVAGTLSFVGAIAKRTSRAITATLSFIGVGGRIGTVFTQSLTAALSFSGAALKSISRSIVAELRLANPEVPFVETGYPESEYGFAWPEDDTGYSLDATDGRCGVGESFISTGGRINSAIIFAYKVGTITGDVYAKLYSATGTHGVDAKPGTLLSTSYAYDLDSYFQDIPDFDLTGQGLAFPDQYEMTAGATYCIEFFWNNGGDSSNKLFVAADRVPPFTYSGNAFEETTPGNWAVLSDGDLCFAIWINREASVLTLLPNKLFLATLSSSAAISKQTTRALSATLSFIGAFTKRASRSLTGVLSFIGTIAKNIPKSLTGTLSFVGAVSKRTARALSAALSFAGNFIYPWQQTASLSFVGSTVKRTARALTATLSFIGAVVKSIPKSLTGTLSFIGTLSRNTARSLVGTLSFVGTLSKRSIRALSATLSFVGSLSHPISHILTASLSFIGSTTKQTNRSLTGALSFVGSITKRASKALSGTLSFTGSLTRSLSYILAASLSFVGSVAKRSNRSLAATLSFIGALSKQLGKSLTGALSFTGSIARQISKSLTAALSFIGSVSKRINRLLASTLSFAGSISTLLQSGAHSFSVFLTAALSFTGASAKSTARSLSGALSFIGAAGRQFPKLLTGTLSFVGAATKQTGKSLTGVLSFIGSLTRRTSKLLSGALSFVGSMATSRMILVALTAALSLAGTLTKSTSRLLSGAVSFIGSLGRATTRALAAMLSFSGSITKSTSRAFIAALSFIGAIISAATQTFLQALTATLSFTGELDTAGRFARALAATLDFAGDLNRSIGKSLQSALSFFGTLSKEITRLLSGTLDSIGEFTAHTITDFVMLFTATLSFHGSVLHRMGRIIPIVIDAIIRFAKIVVGLFSPQTARVVKIVVPGATNSVNIKVD